MLFTASFVDPNQGHTGNPDIVARYPLALVNQDGTKWHHAYHDDLKARNPNIVLLAYNMVIEETSTPGPGHDIQRRARWDTWVTRNSSQPCIGPAEKQRRIFDPRSTAWQSHFINSCHAVLDDFPYNGLFLDQCNIFNLHTADNGQSIDKALEAEMVHALQETLRDLRRSVGGDVILVGNSDRNFVGLNGELNEGRLADLSGEAAIHAGQVQPAMNFYLGYYQSPDDQQICIDRDKAHANSCWFGAVTTPQNPMWPACYKNEA